MCLMDAEHKLRWGEAYAGPQGAGHFEADLRRMLTNCACYNLPGTWMDNARQKLEAVLDRLLHTWVRHGRVYSLERGFKERERGGGGGSLFIFNVGKGGFGYLEE